MSSSAVTHYITNCPPQSQEKLHQLRAFIRNVIPEAEEVVSEADESEVEEVVSESEVEEVVSESEVEISDEELEANETKVTEINAIKEEEEEDEEEEDEEVFEIEIDDVTYYATSEENGILYAVEDDGEVGKQVGVIKDGEPIFS